MSARQSRKGVSVLTTWKIAAPIGVLIVIEPREEADPIPNWTSVEGSIVVAGLVFK
jgi:hypothetical protein